MHIHTGPVGNGNDCGANATLGHWNPGNTNHGSNLDEQRHVGDMGNILTDKEGKAVGSFLAAVQPLFGTGGIINRSVVVHGGTDDLGLGGNETSRATGNAGARIACGTIQSGI
jgi:Cu-Zn family superoxide dismutase